MANNEKLQLALEKDLETVRSSVDEVKKTADAALPSADLTQTKILELIDILSVENGGTGANTKKEAFDNLAFLGNNPISSLEEDTPQKWLELGSGYAKFDTNELMNNQPEQYMFVINFSHESSAIFQIGSLQSGYGIYYRTGNSNGWTINWTPLFGAGSIVPIANGGTGANTADTARENLNAQRRIPQYVSGEGADLDTGTFDFILTTLTATKHKALQDLGFGSFAFVWQFFYQEANNERGRTQFAKSYLTNKIATRYYSSNTKSWSNWTEIFTNNDTVPIANGGTGKTTRNEAFRNLSFLGDKPITSTAQDTTHKWRDLGTGYAWFGTNGAMINQPYTYMFVLNYVQGTNVFQIGSTQSDTNTVYFRSGNDSGWHKNWTPLLSYEYSNTDLTAGSSKLATGKVYFVYE